MSVTLTKGPTIQEQWQHYHDTVLKPEGVGVMQVMMAKRAFYAASHGTLIMMMTMVNSGLTDEVGEVIVDGWFNEHTSFAAMVEDGVA